MKTSNHKYSRPYKRLIHMEDGVWSWRISSEHVWIRSPNGTMTIHTDAFEINGTNWDEYSGNDRIRESYEDNSRDMPMCPAVTPADIKRIIQSLMVKL